MLGRVATPRAPTPILKGRMPPSRWFISLVSTGKGS